VIFFQANVLMCDEFFAKNPDSDVGS